MEIRKIYSDLNDTLIVSPRGNSDLAIVHDIDKKYTGIFRYAVDQLSTVDSWETHVFRAFESLGKFKVSEKDYYSVAEKVSEKITVPESVKKTFEKVSDDITELITFTGSSKYISKLIVDKKLRPLIPEYVTIINLATELDVDENGIFTGKVKKIYGYNDRAEIVRKLRNNESSIGIADNHNNLNLGMIKESTFGIFLSENNSCDRQGNIFYARPHQLPIVVDHILREESTKKTSEELKICKWIERCR